MPASKKLEGVEPFNKFWFGAFYRKRDLQIAIYKNDGRAVETKGRSEIGRYYRRGKRDHRDP